MSLNKINVLEKFDLFDDHWSPKIIAELNGQQVKIAKVQGEFVWHNHSDEDELFYVIKGSISIQLEDKTVGLNQGDLFVVPKGVEHKPVAKEEAWVMLFEPAATKHTGEVDSDLTVENPDKI